MPPFSARKIEREQREREERRRKSGDCVKKSQICRKNGAFASRVHPPPSFRSSLSFGMCKEQKYILFSPCFHSKMGSRSASPPALCVGVLGCTTCGGETAGGIGVGGFCRRRIVSVSHTVSVNSTMHTRRKCRILVRKYIKAAKDIMARNEVL